MNIKRLLLACVVGSFGASPAWAQRVIVPFGTGAIVEHRVSMTGEIERVVGAVWGAGATLTLSDWLGARARIAAGNLSARTVDAEARGFSEADIAITLTPDRWVSFDAGTVVRAMSTPLVRQRWVELRAGSELGVDLIDGVLRGMVRLSIAPWVSVSGHPAPDLSIGGGTGLQYESGRLAASLAYSLERYDFPAAGSARRLEQHSSLTARIGWRVR
jgi:hypothetical protein